MLRDNAKAEASSRSVHTPPWHEKVAELTCSIETRDNDGGFETIDAEKEEARGNFQKCMRFLVVTLLQQIAHTVCL